MSTIKQYIVTRGNELDSRVRVEKLQSRFKHID